MLRITDGFTAYCFDEVCCWMITQLEDGKRPFFGRSSPKTDAAASGNTLTVEMLKNLGAEVKHYDKRGNSGRLSDA